MDTSRPRTPPAPVSAGPRGRPVRLSRQAKNEQIAVWFQVGNREFVRSVRAPGNHSTRPCKPSPFH